MWFNNALIYQCEGESLHDLSSHLKTHPLKPCPPHTRYSYGWLPVLEDAFSQETSNASLIILGKEERLLPRGVIQRLLAERVECIEQQQNRILKRRERTQLAEDLEFELLPKAFCIQKRLQGLVDMATQRLIINTTSQQQAAQFISLLRKVMPTLDIRPLPHSENLNLLFLEWIMHPDTLPTSITLASDCLLISPNDEKKRLTCKGYELPSEEIVNLLTQGLAVAELSLIWNERIQLTLTHDFRFKKLKCLDYLLDEFHSFEQLDDELAQRDAALLLLVSELRELTNALLSAFPTPNTTRE